MTNDNVRILLNFYAKEKRVDESIHNRGVFIQWNLTMKIIKNPEEHDVEYYSDKITFSECCLIMIKRLIEPF